jgi:hypothetical protein
MIQIPIVSASDHRIESRQFLSSVVTSIPGGESRTGESSSREQVFASESPENESASEGPNERFQSVEVETEFQLAESFELWNAGRIRSIESVVMFDGQRLVHNFLLSSPPPSPSELSVLIAEGVL